MRLLNQRPQGFITLSTGSGMSSMFTSVLSDPHLLEVEVQMDPDKSAHILGGVIEKDPHI